MRVTFKVSISIYTQIISDSFQNVTKYNWIPIPSISIIQYEHNKNNKTKVCSFYNL